MPVSRNLAIQIHPEDLVDPEKSEPQHMRFVAVNLQESPLGWLYARGYLSDAQLLAGEKLRCDFERAGMSPQITMRWDAASQGKSQGGVRATDASSAQIDAKERFHSALEAVGPGLCDVCWRVICAGEAMNMAEKKLGWPVRSGRLVLTMALDRLALYYKTG